MTDNVIASAAIGTGATFATKDIAGIAYPRNIITDPSGVDITPAKDATLTAGTQQTKLTDGANPVGVTAAGAVGNELTVDRLKVNASLRMVDTSLTAGTQLVAARGDQTTGLWVNVKNASIPVTGTVAATQSGTWNIGSITTLPALATGANVIGGVTQSGTWNIGTVTTLPALVAGSAIIGKVGIDQTTPGTTNNVNVGTVAGIAPALNTGVRAAGVQRVTVATDDLVPVTANDLTASGNITTQNLVSGGAATAGSAVEIALNGQNTLGIQVTGTYTGALSLQMTVDGTNWITLSASAFFSAAGGAANQITSGSQSTFQSNVAGWLKVRITGLAAMTGTATVSLRAATSAANVQLGSSNATIGAIGLNAGTTLVGDVGVQYRASSTGGASVAKILTAATTNATCPKASAGRFLGFHLTNTTAVVKAIHIHDLAVAPTVGTSVPKYSIILPPNQLLAFKVEGGVAMATGIAYSITGAIGDLDATITAVGDVIGALYYA